MEAYERKTKMTRKYICTDICWDTDGEDTDLPEEVELEIEAEDGVDVDELLADKLSDEYEFCVESFHYREVDDSPDAQEILERIGQACDGAFGCVEMGLKGGMFIDEDGATYEVTVRKLDRDE